MSCCSSESELDPETAPSGLSREVLLASCDMGGGVFRTDLSVPGIKCGACIASVEKSLLGLEGVTAARVNLSTRRVSVTWKSAVPPPFIAALKNVGFDSNITDSV